MFLHIAIPDTHAFKDWERGLKGYFCFKQHLNLKKRAEKKAEELQNRLSKYVSVTPPYITLPVY